MSTVFKSITVLKVDDRRRLLILLSSLNCLYRIWLDNPDLCDNFKGIVLQIRNMLKVRTGETPVGENIVVKVNHS